jgi:hypothetical protein
MTLLSAEGDAAKSEDGPNTRDSSMACVKLLGRAAMTTSAWLTKIMSETTET